MNSISLSVVIPCYNEMANLRKGVLDKVDRYLTKHYPSFEVIVVDDGSNDGSVEFIREFVKEHKEFLLLENKHTGKAGAVTAGMLKAKGEYVLFTDMDQAVPIEEVDTLLPLFDKGADIVIGSRSTTRKGAPFTRLIMSRGMIFLRTLIVGIHGIVDTQCGFKMFRHDVAQKLFKKIYDLHDGFHAIDGSSVTAGFDVELLYIAQKMQYKILEASVPWLYVETRRVNPIKDSIQGVTELIKIKKNANAGKYN